MIMEVEPEDVCIVRAESADTALETIQAWHAQRQREKEGGTDAFSQL